MLQTLDIKENDHILIIAPHPDDECIGPGGLLARYPGQCRVIVLTDGREGQGDAAPERVKAVREREFQEEMSFLGIADYRMLGYEDGTLLRHTDCLEQIGLAGYTEIFVTGMHDNHPDHTAAYLSVRQALQKQGIGESEVYLYEVHAPLQCPTHLLDITDRMEEKQHMIRFHRSQLTALPYDRYAACMAEYRALQNRLCGRRIEVYTRVETEGDTRESAELQSRLQKQILFYQVLTRWMQRKITGGSLAETLMLRGYRRIAVYGYAELGRLLCLELAKSPVRAAYVLDKKAVDSGRADLPVYAPRAGLPAVDAVVVTAVYYFDEIRRDLREMGFDNIISLRTLLEGEEA